MPVTSSSEIRFCCSPNRNRKISVFPSFAHCKVLIPILTLVSSRLWADTPPIHPRYQPILFAYHLTLLFVSEVSKQNDLDLCPRLNLTLTALEKPVFDFSWRSNCTVKYVTTFLEPWVLNSLSFLINFPYFFSSKYRFWSSCMTLKLS